MMKILHTDLFKTVGGLCSLPAGKTGLYDPLSCCLHQMRNRQKPLCHGQFSTILHLRGQWFTSYKEKAYLEEDQNNIRLQKSRNKRNQADCKTYWSVFFIGTGVYFHRIFSESAAERQSASLKNRNLAVKEKAIADSFAAICL